MALAVAQRSSWSSFTRTALIFSILIIPLIAITLVYQLDSFDPAPVPTHELTRPPLKAAKSNSHILKGDAEYLWAGQLQGPEDIAYDSKTGFIYTSCEDGWVKRARVNDSVVENWVNTGGRPLGIALGNDNDVFIADAYKGLLKGREDGRIEVVTDEAEGVKFKITNGVDTGEDGLIYFTDASYKYNVAEVIWDILEGRPNGRLMSYNPKTNITQVLVHDLYFANGLALSPLRDFLVFCETPLSRCRKYNIKGSKKGQVESFVNLPGPPDNIHYHPNGYFFIALASGSTTMFDTLHKYPMLRKILGIVMKVLGPVSTSSNGGVFIVDVEGNPVAHYSDPNLRYITCAVQIENHFYFGSLATSHILRLNIHH